MASVAPDPASEENLTQNCSTTAQGDRYVRYEPFFSWNDPVTVYEVLKLILLTPLALVRFILLIWVLLLWVGLLKLAICCVSSEEGKPRTSRSTACIGRISSCMATLCGALLGFWTTLEGEFPNPRPPIAVFNHVSWVDAILIAKYCTPCTGVAIGYLQHWPLIGTIGRAHQYASPLYDQTFHISLMCIFTKLVVGLSGFKSPDNLEVTRVSRPRFSIAARILVGQCCALHQKVPPQTVAPSSNSRQAPLHQGSPCFLV